MERQQQLPEYAVMALRAHLKYRDYLETPYLEDPVPEWLMRLTYEAHTDPVYAFESRV